MNLLKKIKEELPMTNNTNISITFSIGNGKLNKLSFNVSLDSIWNDLAHIVESLKVRLISSVIMFIDDQIKETKMKSAKVLGTENVTIGTENGLIEINRRVY